MQEILTSILLHTKDDLFYQTFFQQIQQAKQFCLWLEHYVKEKTNKLHIPYDITILHALCNNVLRGIDNHSQVLVAIKRIEFKTGKWNIPLSAIYELETYCQIDPLQSPHLPRLIHLQMQQDYVDIVSELIPYSFSTIMTQCMPYEFLSQKMMELIHVVQLLHKLHISHRDIKADNICFNNKGQLVLLDLDCAVVGSVRKTLPMCTLSSRAPELFYSCTESYNPFAADIWSMACVICQMFLGTPLFCSSNETELGDAIVSFRDQLSSEMGHKVLKRKMPTSIYQLIRGIFLESNPMDRFFHVVAYVDSNTC